MIINQITIPCLDYEASVDFYKTLGMLQIVSAPPRYARFEMPDGEGATLSLHAVEDLQNGGVVIYFDHASPGDLDQTVDALKKKGLTFHKDPTNESWGWREARLYDPSQNEICLMYAGSVRRFPDWRVDGRTS
jgi:hydroxymethylpyrimidine/phosphomethylpyrimidine kinase